MWLDSCLRYVLLHTAAMPSAHNAVGQLDSGFWSKRPIMDEVGVW